MKDRMAKRKQFVVGILVILLVAVLVLTACGPRPIVEGEVAQFGLILALTGAPAAAVTHVLSGTQDYIRYFNDHETIPGVHVECLWRDSMHQHAIGLSHYERLVEAGVPLIGAVESELLLAIKGRLEKHEVVGFGYGVGINDVLYPEPGWIYFSAPAYSERAAAMFEYFMENWKEERAPRVAIVGFDVLPGIQPRWAIGYARGLGFEVLPFETTPFVTLDASVLLLRLKEAEADLVFLQLTAEGAGPILRDAERLGILDEFQFAGPDFAMGERTIKIAGAATEGFLFERPSPWFTETGVPGVKLMTDNMMKYHGRVRRDPEYIHGWVGMAIICEAMRRGIENVGYENLDGPAMKEALDGMKDFDVYGLMSITYRPGDHRGTTKVAVYEVRGGEIVRVSDWREVPFGRDWEFE